MITVITPSVRPHMLPVVEKCLKRQDVDFEWIVTMPEKYHSEITVKPDLLLEDPPKREGDFWSLCKGWNQTFARSKGDLIVNIQDGLWFPPDTLSKFWYHYQKNPRALVGAIGHQYSSVDEYGKPDNKIWDDPRFRADKSFVEVSPNEMEMTMNSIPREALLECGGIDEIYDTCPACGEKEMCWRLNKINWDFYLDMTIEYRAIHHPRLTEDWDKQYIEKTTPLFIKHMNELTSGDREINVNSLNKYLI